MLFGKKRKGQNQNGIDNSSDSSKHYQRYEIESVRSHRVFKKLGRLEFFVKWKDYPEADNTWEPFSMFAQAQPNYIKNYLFDFLDSDGHMETE